MNGIRAPERIGAAACGRHGYRRPGTMTDTSIAAAPLVWLLTDDRPGNRTQVIGTARALGGDASEKRLSFRRFADLPTPLLGATLRVLDGPSRAQIAPPWPDLVIAAGRRVVPVARWIRRESGARARVVMLGRKTPGDFADLTIRCSYFRQPPDPNLLELSVPPSQVDAAALDRVRADEPDPLDGLGHPRCVFLVGGVTGTHAFDAELAGRMTAEISRAAARADASLAIVTSRRTPPEAVAAIRRAAPHALIHEWRADATHNPYLAFLAYADLLAVTGESESMLSEAVRAERPLTIYPLPTLAAGAGARISNAVAEAALRSGRLGPFARQLMSTGWITPRRDLAALHDAIETNGWGRRFDGSLNTEKPAPYHETRVVSDRIRRLLSSRTQP